MPLTVGTLARIISSWRMNVCITSRPAPPYSRGQPGATQPFVARSAAQVIAGFRRSGSSERASATHSYPSTSSGSRLSSPSVSGR